MTRPLGQRLLGQRLTYLVHRVLCPIVGTPLGWKGEIGARQPRTL